MPRPTPVRPLPAVVAGVRATYAAFIATGFVFATWASRIPQVRDDLGLDPAQLGLVLLAIAGGSLVSLPLSGAAVGRVGSRRTVVLMALVNAASLGVIALGSVVGVVALVIGLFAFGFAQGAWDVAMNVQGTVAERRLGRAIMSRFHAGFSVGTVAGALLGAVAVALGIPVWVHLCVIAALVVVVVPYAVRGFLPDTDETDAVPTGTAGGRVLAAWREPRTVLIGLFVLAFTFGEGTGNDWTSVAFIDGYGTSAVIGTLGFAAFLGAMTVGRWFGPGLLDRYGRVVVVRWLALIGVVGVVLLVVGGSTPVGFVGALLWGVGVSLGFPVGMSAAADDPTMAAARVSVVASVGYCAFLAGPPLIGFLGHQVGVLQAFSAVAALLGAAFLLAGNVR
ncbi:MAG: MFS transporter, partial [Marmoricola sp.]